MIDDLLETDFFEVDYRAVFASDSDVLDFLIDNGKSVQYLRRQDVTFRHNHDILGSHCFSEVLDYEFRVLEKLGFFWNPVFGNKSLKLFKEKGRSTNHNFNGSFSWWKFRKPMQQITTERRAKHIVRRGFSATLYPRLEMIKHKS